MSWSALAYTAGLALASVLLALLAAYGWRSWRKLGRPGAREFTMLMAAAAVWSLFYSLELASAGLGQKLLFAKAEYLGILAIPPAWFLFAHRYTGATAKLPAAVRALFVLMPTVTFALLVTTGWHGLMWSRAELPASGAFPGLVIEHGLWFWINMAYSYSLLLLGSVWLVRRVYNYPHVYRHQAVVLISAALVPWAGNALLIFRILPPGTMDPSPFAFLFSGVAIAWSMSRFRFLSLPPALLPIVRDQLLHRISDGVLVLDAEGRVVHANPAAGEMLGVQSSLLSGRPAAEVLGSGLPQPGVLDTGGDLQLEVTLGVDPAERTYDVVSSALRVPDGPGVGRLLVLRDVTERRRAEEGLKKSESKYRHLYEGMIDAYVRVNMDGDFAEFNRAFQDMLGYEPEELLQLRFSDVTPERWHAYEMDIVRRQVLPRGYSEIYEKEYRRKDGSVFPGELRTELITDEDGNPTGMWAIVRDISERKKAEESLRETEEQLRQAQKMEAVGQLAGGIAHDFNNLLTAIIGYADMALQIDHEGCPGKDDILEIKKAAEQATGLTRQILAFSRRQTLQPRVVSLNDVLKDTWSLLQRTLGEDVELTLRPDPDLGSTEIDPGQLQQVLVNMAVNARSAMPSGGRLTIATANVDVGDEASRSYALTMPPGPYVVLTVTDTGCGMDEITRSRIFEPFYTTKALGEGTGLGLSTVYGIVKQSGGSITVQSAVGTGTTFSIYLPRVEGRPQEQREPVAEAGTLRGREVILIVEDEVAIRSLIFRILGLQGYSVLKASEGEEARRILQNSSIAIDLLLTDVMLPGAVQGHVLAGLARASRPNLPVLFMSGYTHSALTHDGRLDEGINFLEKPFTATALVRKVREVLDTPLVKAAGG